MGRFRNSPTFINNNIAILPLVTKTSQKPYSSCFIDASSCCSTTIISKVLTACLGLVKQRQQDYYYAVYCNSDIQGYWLIKNSNEVSEVVSEVNQRGQVSSIKTYDFSTIYTNIPHKKLKQRIPRLVKESFESIDKKYISVDRHYNAIWTKNTRISWLLLSCEDGKVYFLFDNVFIQLQEY